ncbi:hypothetical protein PCANC_21470 [Puccinia coronata f. sp. avenae]|uniref:Uncharacterized protein n=1 Tax=Puccinia coronata f. sp. avenae TaxID=200324 RepID=A0A2N5TJS3_9BASI|nr:hypothetical protein PCASD_25332 [Puccinia coronata f. sp. avenae]PLW31110.1 hypothetical protein PCANC_21470 [Puccinia coronata f. sp. avenae]
MPTPSKVTVAWTIPVRWDVGRITQAALTRAQPSLFLESQSRSLSHRDGRQLCPGHGVWATPRLRGPTYQDGDSGTLGRSRRSAQCHRGV